MQAPKALECAAKPTHCACCGLPAIGYESVTCCTLCACSCPSAAGQRHITAAEAAILLAGSCIPPLAMEHCDRPGHFGIAVVHLEELKAWAALGAAPFDVQRVFFDLPARTAAERAGRRAAPPADTVCLAVEAVLAGGAAGQAAGGAGSGGEVEEEAVGTGGAGAGLALSAMAVGARHV